MPITSPKNSLLQEVRRAAASGRPTEEGLIIAEGPHLAEEAIRGRWRVELILVSETYGPAYADLFNRSHAEVIAVSEPAFAATATTQAHQGIITLLRPRKWTWDDLKHPQPLIVVLDGVQDPGNAGAIVRSAEAFGGTAVVFLPGSVRIANGKFLRAAAGSAFRLPLLENVSGEMLLAEASAEGLNLYALSPDAPEDLSDIDLRGPTALILGSEGAGISAAMRRSTLGIRIPVLAVESLNVGIAGSIALFEAARQRRIGP